jgi:hypothetical protein
MLVVTPKKTYKPCDVLFALSNHQLDIRTPGINPRSASFRKQILHRPNFRYTARGRPHNWQRLSARVLNFGVRFALAIFDLLATEYSSLAA